MAEMPTAVAGILTIMFGASPENSMACARAPARRGTAAGRSGWKAARCARCAGRTAEQLRGLDGQLVDQAPADRGLRLGRSCAAAQSAALLPARQVCWQGRQCDHRIAGGAYGSPADCLCQLGRSGRVVPEAGRSGCHRRAAGLLIGTLTRDDTYTPALTRARPLRRAAEPYARASLRRRRPPADATAAPRRPRTTIDRAEHAARSHRVAAGLRNAH